MQKRIRNKFIPILCFSALSTAAYYIYKRQKQYKFKLEYELSKFFEMFFSTRTIKLFETMKTFDYIFK